MGTGCFSLILFFSFWILPPLSIIPLNRALSLTHPFLSPRPPGPASPALTSFPRPSRWEVRWEVVLRCHDTHAPVAQ